MSGTVTLTFFGKGDSGCSVTSIGTCANIVQLDDGVSTDANTWTGYFTLSGVSGENDVQSGFFCNPDGTVNYYADFTDPGNIVTIDYGVSNNLFGIFSEENQSSDTCFSVKTFDPTKLNYYFKITCDGSPGPEPDPDPSPSSSSGLSDGEIAAIVTGSVVAAILIYVLYIKFFSNK